MSMIKCPECGHQISDKAPVCPVCGIEIAGKTTRCLHCGEVYFKDQPMCPNCHHPTVNSNASPQPGISSQALHSTGIPPVPPVQQAQAENTATTVRTPNNPQEKKKSYVSLLVSFIIALTIAAVCFYFYTKASDDKEREAYNYALQSDDPQVLQSFLDTYKGADEAHRDSITAHLVLLKQINQEWTNALVSNSKSAMERYLEQFPNAPHKQEALQKIDDFDWETARDENTEDAYNSYLQDHPNGNHVDEANNHLKEVKAKTVQPEERQMINATFKRFFQSINAKDEDALMTTVSDVMTSFLNKHDATKQDVVTFMNKLYKDDVTNLNWRLMDDYKIEKKEVGIDEYEYTVQFSANKTVESNEDGKSDTERYKVNARVNPDGKISTFNLVRILE